ncbi:phage integrase Arm DNA-binding domain-containing protein [Mannheimia haemolytica]
MALERQNQSLHKAVRPRKQQNQYLPENLRPKAVTRKSGKTVIYWLYRTHGKTEISLGTNRNEAFLKAAQLNIERESKPQFKKAFPPKNTNLKT